MIPTTMRGVCLTEDLKLELRDLPLNKPHKGFVLIKVKRAGICATDIGYWRFGGSNLKLPVILGHEVCGVIESIGEDVMDFKIGDKVIVMNDYYVCGTCRYCISGATNMCIHRRSIGSKENGAFSEYMLVPETSVLSIPDNISFEEGALMEVLACGVHAIYSQVKPKKGDIALIIGPGAIGISTAIAAKEAGCKVILAGLTKDKERLDIAKSMGIDFTVDLSKEDLKSLVMEQTDDYGADIVVECAGNYKSVETCFNLAAKRSKYCQMGVLHGGGADLSPLISKEITAIGSYAKTKADWIITRELVSKHKYDFQRLIGEILPLEKYEYAFQKALEGESFRILFNPEL